MQHPTFLSHDADRRALHLLPGRRPEDAPTLLLLHGLPSSSRMYEPLSPGFPTAITWSRPTIPGFGHSDWPDPNAFAYTFDRIAHIMDRFTEALGLSRYTLYLQDYGGPVGFRMALAHPERVEALIVQDAVAHNEGLGANWGTRRAFWADRAANESALRANFCRSQPRAPAMSAAIPTWIATTLIYGPTNSLFLASRDRRTSRAISSTTTEPTSRLTRNGRRGCASGSRGSSSSGANTTRRLTFRNRNLIAATSPRPKSMSSTPAISRSTPRRIRLRGSCAGS